MGNISSVRGQSKNSGLHVEGELHSGPEKNLLNSYSDPEYWVFQGIEDTQRARTGKPLYASGRSVAAAGLATRVTLVSPGRALIAGSSEATPAHVLDGYPSGFTGDCI